MKFELDKVVIRPGALEAVIEECEKQLQTQLPEEYREFLKQSNGCEGFLGSASYVIFWPVEELASMNRAYEVDRYLHGGLLFGSDGGGEAYGFDLRTTRRSIVQVPFIGMGWPDAVILNSSFANFVRQLSARSV